MSLARTATGSVGDFATELLALRSPQLQDGPQVMESVIMPSGRSVPRTLAELWTARQRQGHGLHEISYRACFKAELPAFFIQWLTKPGDTVLDPFMGRGTTLLEAALRGRIPWGNDANPLCPMLVAPRLIPPRAAEVHTRLAEIDWSRHEEPGLDLSMFYHRTTLRALTALRGHLRRRQESGALDPVDAWIRVIALNRLTGHSPGFFSVYTLPPNQAVSPEKQRRLNQKRHQTPPERDVAAIIIRKSDRLLRAVSENDRALLAQAAEGQPPLEDRLACGPAGSLTHLTDESVDLTVTSPPFVNVVDYSRDNWLRCWFAGLDATEIRPRILHTTSLATWSSAMATALAELHRVTRPGGWVAFEVGEVWGGSLPLDEVIAPLGETAGLRCEGIAVNTQAFTKTANCWGIDNNQRGTNTNRIVLLRRP